MEYFRKEIENKVCDGQVKEQVCFLIKCSFLLEAKEPLILGGKQNVFESIFDIGLQDDAMSAYFSD